MLPELDTWLELASVAKSEALAPSGIARNILEMSDCLTAPNISETAEIIMLIDSAAREYFDEERERRRQRG